MLVLVVTVRVHPEKAATYEAICRDMHAKIKANEPGSLFNEVAKSRDEPNTYRVVEAYKDEAAFAVRHEAPYFKAVFADLQACVAGPVVVQMHDAI